MAANPALCAYCQTRRAVNRDHVVPKSLARKHQRMRGALPPRFHDTVPCCLECNVRKGARRLIPPCWAEEVDTLNDFFPGVPFRVWNGDPSAPEFAEVHR